MDAEDYSEEEDDVAGCVVVTSEIKLDLDYTKSIAGILKPVELMLLLTAWSLCASFRNGFVRSTGFSYSTGAAGFFMFVTVTLWLILTLVFVLNLLSITKRIALPAKLLILGGFHALGAVLLLICSAVVAADAARIAKLPETNPGFHCQNLDKYPGFDTTCGTYDAAVGFGFMSFLAFVVDAVVHFLYFHWLCRLAS